MHRRTLVLLALFLVAPTVAAAETLERIANEGVLRLGYRDTAMPFSFTDPTTRRPAGYSVALCEAIAEDIAAAAGVTEIELAYVPVTAANRFDAIVQGDVDLVCGAATQTLSRRARVDFSIPTFVDGAGIALRENGAQSFEDLAGGKIAVTEGTTTEEAIRRTVEDAGLDVEIVTVADHEAGLAQLSEGTVDAFLAERAILQFRVDRSGIENVVVAADQLTVETHAIAMLRGEDDLRLAVDSGLSRLYRTGEAEVLFKQAFGAEAEMTDLLRALYALSSLPR